MKKLILGLVLAFAANVAMAAVKIGDLWYELDANEKTARVINDNDGDSWLTPYPSLRNVEIPSQVRHDGETYTVTSIRDAAFYDCSGLTGVAIPSSVTRIGDSAFNGCRGLTSVTIPSGVTSIGDNAFDGCDGLTSVMIPSSMTSIGDLAFFSCDLLERVMFQPENPPTVGERVFDNAAEGFLILVPEGTCEAYRKDEGLEEYDIVEHREFSVVFTKGEGVEKIEFRCNGEGELVEFPSEGMNLMAGTKIELEVTPEKNYRYTGKTRFTVKGEVEDALVADEIAWGDKARPWVVGDAVTAYTNGTELAIEGTGAMYDFADVASVPWADVAGEVTMVTIADGVTKVGANAFAGFAENVPVSGLSATVLNNSVSASEPVIPEGMVLVAKEELQAAKAEAVTVADGVVSLGVTVNTNGNFTAEAKSWAPVELKQENVKVENGKIVISIPVDSQSGFMILQSGDAKVGAGNAD